MRNKLSLGVAVLLLFVSLLAHSQRVDHPKKVSFKRQLNDSAKQQITRLKNGVLLVRLKTNENVVNALRKSGKADLADKVVENQKLFNQNIVSAFKENFTFCPVYFFYSNYSKEVKEGRFQQIVFLNESLQPDDKIQFPGKSFFVADFGTVEQDTATYYSHSGIEPDGNFSVKKADYYYGGPSFGYDALIIRNDQLIQLRHPFPYFIRTRGSHPKKKVIVKVVKTMDRKLSEYYASVNNR
jgi:hypothetical protein